jgi:hypothetical protein
MRPRTGVVEAVVSGGLSHNAVAGRFASDSAFVTWDLLAPRQKGPASGKS